MELIGISSSHLVYASMTIRKFSLSFSKKLMWTRSYGFAGHFYGCTGALGGDLPTEAQTWQALTLSINVNFAGHFYGCKGALGGDLTTAAQTWQTLTLPIATSAPGNRLCDAYYVGFSARHLDRRITEHKHSEIGRHLMEAHGSNHLLKEKQVRVLRKRQGNFDRLVYKMLFIKNLKPNWNIQTDSVRAKLFLAW